MRGTSNPDSAARSKTPHKPQCCLSRSGSNALRPTYSHGNHFVLWVLWCTRRASFSSTHGDRTDEGTGADSGRPSSSCCAPWAPPARSYPPCPECTCARTEKTLCAFCISLQRCQASSVRPARNPVSPERQYRFSALLPTQTYTRLTMSLSTAGAAQQTGRPRKASLSLALARACMPSNTKSGLQGCSKHRAANIGRPHHPQHCSHRTYQHQCGQHLPFCIVNRPMPTKHILRPKAALQASALLRRGTTCETQSSLAMFSSA